jgi:hypothetical protein
MVSASIATAFVQETAKVAREQCPTEVACQRSTEYPPGGYIQVGGQSTVRLALLLMQR